MQSSFITLITTIFVALLLGTSCASEDETTIEIKKLRQISNEALRNHDLEMFASQWTDEFTLISSRGRVYRGKGDNKHSYGRMFELNPKEWYERTPKDIFLNKGWNIATENGEWKGEFQEGNTTYQVSGTYMAKWIKQNQEWKLQSEYYSPGKCKGGPYCNETLPEAKPSYKFHHTALYVSDMEKSVEFYTKVSGLQIDQKIDTLVDLAADGSKTARAINITFLKFDNGQHILELIESPQATEGEVSYSYQHVGIAVDNIDEAWNKMIQAGAMPRREPWSLLANGDEVTIGFITGPDGEIVELMEWK